MTVLGDRLEAWERVKPAMANGVEKPAIELGQSENQQM